jgi:hypothetical protein
MWNWLIYGALTGGVLAIVGALVLLGARILQAWRAFKRLRRHGLKELDRVLTLAETAAEKAEHAMDTTRLEQSLSELRATLARFAVLREAAGEVGDTIGRFTAFYPRK